MEKGFNDKELADIMSEIESLEREFAAEPVAEAVAGPVAEPVVAAQPEAAVLKELVEHPVERSVPKTNYQENKVVPMKSAPAASAPAQSCLTFKVEGEMTLGMKFEVHGQWVDLQVTPDGLSIQTETGAKFILPLGHDAARKAS